MNTPPDPHPRVMPGERIQKTASAAEEKWVVLEHNKYVERSTLTGRLRTVLPVPK